MKKIISFILFLSILFSSSLASTIDWDTFFEDVRPEEEIETIEMFLDIITETYNKDEEMNNEFNLMLEYFSNVDLICAVFTLKNVSKYSISNQERQSLKNELEASMTHLRDSWYQTLELLGISGLKINVFCNTNDVLLERVAEVWWNDHLNSNDK